VGLDVSHDTWHGAYSAFSRWRNGIAEAAGFDLTPREEMHGQLGYWRDEWETIPDLSDKLMGKWDTPPDDPLLVLLIHSDCDGVIPAAVVPFLADRLEALLPKLTDEEVGGHIGNMRTKTQTFIDGLRAAAEAREDVEFW
jgi:hypothetical protein